MTTVIVLLTDGNSTRTQVGDTQSEHADCVQKLREDGIWIVHEDEAKSYYPPQAIGRVDFEPEPEEEEKSKK